MHDESAAPILVISARDSEPDRLTGFDRGADDYLTKPFSLRELLARVNVALRRSTGEDQPARSSPLNSSVITVDVDRHEVRKRGALVHLAPKEFELLDYLARHPNPVCTRDQILESAWGYHYAGETRTVDVHMHWLRQKLEDEPARPVYLMTVRHYGYKFVPGEPENLEG